MTDLRNPRHVVILGAGAMGSLFGGILKEGGLNVTLVDIWKEHVEAINRSGLRMVGYGGDRSIPIQATTDVASVGRADIVSVHCKAADTVTATRPAAHLFRDGTVAVSFQNGIGNEERIASVIGQEQVLGGWTAQGASVETAGVVRNYGELPSQLGEMGGGLSDRTRHVAAAFSEAGLPTKASSDIVGGMWKKMMINIALSAPSAFTRLPIEKAAAVPHMRTAIDTALVEAAAVARASGVGVDLEEARRLLDTLVGEGGTGAKMSSLCVDVLRQRLTEIDVINGVVVLLGREFGIPTPVNAAFVAAVKGLESHYLARDWSP